MKEKLIENILENFDFEKVRKVMEFLNWTWATTPEPNSVPTTYQLIKSSKERLENAYKCALKEKENYYSSSGGFEAFAEYNDKTKKVDYLELKFILTDWAEQADDNYITNP